MPGQTHTTSCNIIAHDVFHALGHPVAKCCNMHLVWYWIKFKNGQSFVAIFLDVARCCARLASSFTTSHNTIQQCWKMLCRNVACVWLGIKKEGVQVVMTVQVLLIRNISRCNHR